MWNPRVLQRRVSLVAGAAVLTAVLTLLVGCQVNAWRHQPQMAAEAAVAFATKAFVEDDVPSAFAQLPSSRQEKNSVEAMAGAVNALHPDGRPTSIEVVEYQPLPGYHGMNVFLEGRSSARTYYYRFLMEGDASSGYHVKAFERALGPFPNPDQRKALP